MQAQRIKSMLVRFVAVGMVAFGFLLGSGLIEGGVPRVSASELCCARPYDRY